MTNRARPPIRPTLALSIQQPWAWLIVHGHKDIENRTWAIRPSFTLPQRIYVHAGKVARPTSDVPGWGRFDASFWKSRPELGAIVGEVTITACVTRSESPWFEGPYGFVLIDPVAYQTPIPYRGRLGFFPVPDLAAAKETLP